MKILWFTKILISVSLLFIAVSVQAETIVTNDVSVSAHGGSDGEASVSTHVVSTINGETTEYHYNSGGSATSTSYTEVIIDGVEMKEEATEEITRAIYLKLIERLLEMINLLQAKI